MNIDSIQNGIVLDHITAGKALQIYNDLHLDKLDCSVAIIKNVKSEKMGRKDILKIDQDIDINLDVLGYIDQDISVNIIKDGKLLPPFVAISGLGENAAWDLMRGREGKTFLSVEEVAAACPKVSKTHIQMLREAGAFGDLPDTSQVSFF